MSNKTKGTSKLATWEALGAALNRKVVAPSGFAYVIRPPILEHYKVGDLPPTLMRLELLSGAEKMAYLERLEDDDLKEAMGGNKVQADGLVRAILVEPEVAPGEEGEKQLDQLPSVDYEWLTQVALRNTDVDAEGTPIYGTEPLSRLEPFREDAGSDAVHTSSPGREGAVA